MLPRLLAHRFCRHLLIVIYQCTQITIISNWIRWLIKKKYNIFHNLRRIVFEIEKWIEFFIQSDFLRIGINVDGNVSSHSHLTETKLNTANYFDLSIFHKILMSFISFECHYRLNRNSS